MTLADKIVVLDAGRVAQVGKPLGSSLADRFVAGFIGSPKMNFLPVKCRDGLDQVQVELPNRPANLATGGQRQRAGGRQCNHRYSTGALPSDIADVTLEGEVRSSSSSVTAQIHNPIPAIRQNLVYRQNDVVVVEGATFAIGCRQNVAIYSVRMAPLVVSCIKSRACKASH